MRVRCLFVVRAGASARVDAPGYRFGREYHKEPLRNYVEYLEGMLASVSTRCVFRGVSLVGDAGWWQPLFRVSTVLLLLGWRGWLAAARMADCCRRN